MHRLTNSTQRLKGRITLNYDFFWDRSLFEAHNRKYSHVFVNLGAAAAIFLRCFVYRNVYCKQNDWWMFLEN